MRSLHAATASNADNFCRNPISLHMYCSGAGRQSLTPDSGSAVVVKKEKKKKASTMGSNHVAGFPISAGRRNFIGGIANESESFSFCLFRIP